MLEGSWAQGNWLLSEPGLAHCIQQGQSLEPVQAALQLGRPSCTEGGAGRW